MRKFVTKCFINSAFILRHFLLIIISFFALSCNADNDNILSPSKLEGNYTLQSFKDKMGNTTFLANQPKQITVDGEPLTVTISGSLELTDSRYTLNFVQVVVGTGAPQRLVIEDKGAYSINGFTMIRVHDNGGETKITCRIIDGKLIMEDPQVQFIFI